MFESRIGIFGGSFDPVHNGHVKIVQESISQLKLDLLYVIPISKAPHKTELPVASANHRLEMLKIALHGISNAQVSDIETARGEVSYTIDTLKQLQTIHRKSEFVFIIGSDMLSTLDLWKNIDEIKEICAFVVVARKGSVVKEAYQRLNMNPVEISSSEVRNSYKIKKTAHGLVPDQVEEYIIKHNLYLE